MIKHPIRIAAVAFALVLVLAACGSSKSSSSGGGASSSKLPPCDVGALANAKQPVEITFWNTMTRANLDTLKKLTDQFNSSQHEVHVNLVNQNSYDDAFNKWQQALSTGGLPDMVQLQDIDLQQMIDSRSVLPAQSCINASHYDTSDFIPRTLAYWNVGGVQYAMPFNVSNPVFLYRKSAFQKAGLDPNKPPANWDELHADAEALKKSGLQAGMGLKLDPWHLEQWSALAGQTYVNNENGRKARATAVTFDSPAGLNVFKQLDSLVRSGLAATNPNSGPSQYDNLLGMANGKYGMTIDSSAVLGTVYQLLGSGQYGVSASDLGVAPMPGATPQGGVLVGGASLYMSIKSSPEKQAAAWKYITFLDSPDSQATWGAGTGYVPIRKSATTNPVMQAAWQKEPGLKVAYDQLVNGPTNPATAGPVLGAYAAVRQAVLDAENSMYLQGTAPDKALADAAKHANAAITSYNQRIGG